MSAQEHTDFWSLSYLQSLQKTGYLQQKLGILPWMSEQLDYFIENGFPTRKNELWKYTDINPIIHTQFGLPMLAKIENVDLSSASFLENTAFQAVRLVFVNGYFSPLLSNLKNCSDKIQVMNLLSAGQQFPEQVAKFVNEFSQTEPLQQTQPYFSEKKKTSALAALNAAFITDGIFLNIPANIQLPTPIHLLHISTQEDIQTMRHLRHMISVGEGSQVQLFEEYVGGINANVYFDNVITQINLESQAELDYYKLQREHDQAFHTAQIEINQQRNSISSFCTVSLGGKIARDDLKVNLLQPGASSQLYGLYLPKSKQHIAHYSLINHIASHTQSQQHYRGLMSHQSHAVFNGKVKVFPEATKVDANQANHNLLLTPQAIINSKPELEIYADDVKCSHGATVGQLDSQALFYLQSRGVPEEEASMILMRGFAEQVLAMFPKTKITDYLHQHITDRTILL